MDVPGTCQLVKCGKPESISFPKASSPNLATSGCCLQMSYRDIKQEQIKPNAKQTHGGIGFLDDPEKQTQYGSSKYDELIAENICWPIRMLDV